MPADRCFPWFFMQFLSSKTAAVAVVASGVRLPQSATQGFSLPNFKGARAVPAPPAGPRPQHRADQSRYQAKCRVAMSF